MGFLVRESGFGGGRMTGNDPRLQLTRPCFNFDADSERQRRHTDGKSGMVAFVPANEFLLPWVEMKSPPSIRRIRIWPSKLPRERTARRAKSRIARRALNGMSL
jgi:hypothetical protein